MLTSFLKKLQIFGVLFGGRARKLAGIRDRDNVFTDTITFTAPDTIDLTFTVPEFLKKDTYFRVKNGGGANEDQLFRVASVSGSTITVDSTTIVTTFGPAIADIDARLAVVHDNPLISKLNSEGDTIFNIANGAITTGLDDCSDLGIVLAEHYHDDGGLVSDFVYVQHFTVGDWFVTDAGKTYSIDIAHNLNVLFPDTKVYEDVIDEQVWLHKTKILDSDNLRISVSNQNADARFDGTIRVEKS